MSSQSPKKRSLSRVINKQRGRRVNARAIARFSDSVLRCLELSKEVGIALVNDKTILGYNRAFLHHDWTTDVIAFSYEPRPTGVDKGELDYLGDVIISVETAARNARLYRLSLLQELKNLVLHGILHLRGYDHVTDKGEMRAVEKKLRRKLI